MRMTHAELYESLDVLAKAEETGMLGYAISVNRRKITAEVKEYVDKRDELLRKHGTDQGNGQFSLTPDAAVAFFKELEPYGNVTAEIDLMQVTPEVFCGGKLTSQQMFTLGWMVKE